MEPTLKNGQIAHLFLHPLIANPLTPNRLRGILGFILLLTLMASFRILLGGIPFFFYYGRHSFPKPKIPKTTAERAYDGLGSDITPMETKPESPFWENRVTLNVV